MRRSEINPSQFQEYVDQVTEKYVHAISCVNRNEDFLPCNKRQICRMLTRDFDVDLIKGIEGVRE